MKVLALTGGIASGKSTVCRLFEELGAVVLYADREAHLAYAPGTPLFQEIKRRFGDRIVRNGQIDRGELARILFSSPEEKKWLEQKIHPPTRQAIAAKLAALSKQDPPLVLVEAALHAETGYYKEFDGLIVVYTPETEALDRLKARDGITEDQARLRMANQMPVEEKKKLADWIIDNSGSLEETGKQVEELYRELTS